MTSEEGAAAEGRAKRGAMRVLEVLAAPQDRPRQGLMQHEFLRAFSSEGWTMKDFRAATHYAYEARWIDLEGPLYRLTKRGREKMGL